MSKQIDLTPSQARWLRHIEASRSRGETMSEYAARKQLSVGAMYEAARALRRKGALPGRPRASGVKDRSPGREDGSPFLRVPVAPRPPEGATWRARLPNGVLLEGKDALGPELVSLFASL